MNLIPAFFIIDQENIGIRKKHAIKNTTYGITPYICVVKHNCKANMVKRLFKRYIDLLGFERLACLLCYYAIAFLFLFATFAELNVR